MVAVLLDHAHDELFHLFEDVGLAKGAPALTTVELLGDKPFVPAHESIRRGNGGDLFEAFAAERVCQRGEAAALEIGETQPSAAELGFEDAILFLGIGDHLLLVTLHPASDHGDQELEAVTLIFNQVYIQPERFQRGRFSRVFQPYGTPVRITSVGKWAPLKLIAIVSLSRYAPLVIEEDHTPSDLK